MMLCDECLSPVLSESESDRLGTRTDNSDSMISLGGKILSIDTIMVQLAQRRASCRRRINELSSRTARIPSEILIEIFQMACQPGHRTKKAVTPLFIGSICRLWRDVAWSTPLLWNTIFLHISQKNHGSQVQLLRVLLLNARLAPLSIKLTAEDEHESVLCAFEAIMRILVTRSNYWLTFDSLLPPQYHNTLKNINFPMLTSVSLHILESTIATSHTHPVNNMFLTAPKLVDVNLQCYNSPVMLPWKQVRRFRIGLSSVAECSKVLRQSPSLEECHFEYVYSSLADSLISETVMPHAQLKHLDISLQDSMSMSLFDHLTLPSLSSLRIQYNRGTRLLLSSITSLFLRSACNLERFTIGNRFHCEDLIPCLEAIPSLTYFHLETLNRSYMGLTRDFVASLDPLSNSSRLLLPNLKYFEYEGRVLCDCRIIVDMLANRWHLSDDGGSSQSSRVSKLKLADILVTTTYHVPPDMQEKIRNLLKEGMLVKIESIFKN